MTFTPALRSLGFQRLLTVLLACGVSFSYGIARAETAPSSSKRPSISSASSSRPTLFTSGEFSVQLNLEPNSSGDKVRGVSSIHYAYSSTAAAGTYRMVLTEPLSSPNRFGLRSQSGERTRKVLLEKTGKLSFHLKKGVKVQDALIKSKLVPDGGKVCLSLTLEVQSPTLERLSPLIPFTLYQ